eukprot:7391334-Prymnesium_polylepis.2
MAEEEESCGVICKVLQTYAGAGLCRACSREESIQLCGFRSEINLCMPGCSLRSAGAPLGQMRSTRTSRCSMPAVAKKASRSP